MNNVFNVVTSLIPNEQTYEFKIKNKLTTISEKINGKFMIDKKFQKSLNEIRLQMRQEAFDAMSFVNVKAKVIHDKRHKSLL